MDEFGRVYKIVGVNLLIDNYEIVFILYNIRICVFRDVFRYEIFEMELRLNSLKEINIGKYFVVFFIEECVSF